MPRPAPFLIPLALATLLTALPARSGPAGEAPKTTPQETARDAASARANHPWAVWVDGSWAEYERRDGKGGVVLERETLVDLTDTDYTIERSASIGGTELDPLTSTWPYAMGGYAHTSAEAEHVGREVVKVQGRAIGCDVWKVAWDKDGESFVEQSWMAEGRPLPLRTLTVNGKRRIELVVTSLSEWLTVNDKKLPCVLYEGGYVNGSESSTIKTWRSTHVPGNTVKWIVTDKSKGPDGLVVRELTGFRGERR
jgi:hypothetical protein